MRKYLFTIMACCLAVTSAFSQITINFKLSEDNPNGNEAVYDDVEYGRLYARTIGEPDEKGRTEVQLELENSSDYFFLLFDRVWNKKELRKNSIVREKNFGGETSKDVQNIQLVYRNDINEIEPYTGRYVFPNIIIEDETTFECKIPIHLAASKPCLFNIDRKKLHSIIDCTVRISVDTKDMSYEIYKNKCDELLDELDEALQQKDFCVNPLHKPPFDEQVSYYTQSKQELESQIRNHLTQKGWPKSSPKFQPYADLLDSLDEIDVKLDHYKKKVKHDCGKHRHVHKCRYCKLSLKEIYDMLNNYYQQLFVGEIQKSDIIKEVNEMYKCCTDPACTTHSQAWKNGDPYKSGIEEFYRKIKDF